MDEDPQAPRRILAPSLMQIGGFRDTAQESWRREPSIQQLAPQMNRPTAIGRWYGTIGEIAQGRGLWRADPYLPTIADEDEEGDGDGEESEPERGRARQKR